MFVDETNENLVEYVNHMGSDEEICDAARVSMNKRSDMYTVEQNNKLLRYLASHGHWSPFSHTSLKLRFNAPLFVARQLAKHQVGFAWNEISRRYVKTDIQFWLPRNLRKAAENVKQGSSDDVVCFNRDFISHLKTSSENALELYNDMVVLGVCPEQARMVLPQNMMTQWIWTGSLYAWYRMYELRSDSHSQKETQLYARMVDRICSKYFPIAWSELKDAGHR